MRKKYKSEELVPLPDFRATGLGDFLNEMPYPLQTFFYKIVTIGDVDVRKHRTDIAEMTEALCHCMAGGRWQSRIKIIHIARGWQWLISNYRFLYELIELPPCWPIPASRTIRCHPWHVRELLACFFKLQEDESIWIEDKENEPPRPIHTLNEYLETHIPVDD